MVEPYKRDAIVNLIVIGLFIMSLCTISSATSDFESYSFIVKQCIWFFVGGLFFVWMKHCNYRFLAKHAFLLYVAGIFFLMSLFVLGKKVNGAISWIDLGVLRLQPSEIVRISTLLMLSRVYERNQGKILETKQLSMMFLILVVPTFLVLVQPDLGMALIYLSLAACIFMLTQLPTWIHLSAFFGTLLFFIALYGLYSISPDTFFEVIRPHQYERLISFMHPESDPLGSGYQYIQAKKFVGSGQLTGAGILLMLSDTTVLPEKHTDFIFAVIAHQWGFIGASLLLMLYYLLFYRLIHWAMSTKDAFASFFISGMITMWSFQIFVNIGMNIGLSPITGLTLPFISYGGSSLISNLIALGIIFSMQKPVQHWQIE